MSTTSKMPAPRATGHVFIATSVDGYIARTDGEIDWLTRYATGDEDTGYGAFMDSIDGLVMGRGTFENGAVVRRMAVQKACHRIEQEPLAERTAGRPDNKVRISSLAPRPLMHALAADGWRRTYVDGGKVIQSFLKERLISDIVLTRVPVLLGDGISLFGRMEGDVTLRHTETITFASGLVQSRYEVAYHSI